MLNHKELPLAAWTKLEQIGHHDVDAQDPADPWVKAFVQIQWVAIRQGRPCLTEAGRRALRDRVSEA